MSLRFTRLTGHVLTALLFAVLSSAGLCAQQSKVLAPHLPIAPKVPKPIPLGPPVQSSMVGGPWMIDANFKSSIYLKNVVETSPVTITPVLYLSNGAKYVLHDVILEPAGTAIVDVNAGLAEQGIASYATLSGYVELQYAWPWNPICAMIRDVDVAHSLIFTFGIQAPPTSSPQSTLTVVSSVHITEGVWWKQENNVTGFVSLANTSSQPLTAKVQVSDSRAAILGVHTVTISPHGMKTLNMQELHSAPTSAGGLRVSYLGPQDALLLNGGLEDQSAGYSANLRFISSLAAPVLPPSSHLTAPTSVATLGLMVGAADPIMSFPAGTAFTPYSVLRNTSSSPISVTPTLWWMQAGASHSAPLAAISLLPYQTRSLDVTSMLSRAGLKNFNGSVNLAFDVQGKVNGLLIAAGSVDQTNTYVFEVAPRGIVESAGKSLSYWSTGNGDDTMVTLWNPADEAQDFQFRLSFSGGHYGVPIHLEPRATRVFNISEIIQNQVPDAEGNIVPPTVQMGSAKLAGANADNESILVAMDSGVYNVRKATCGGSCMSCDGFTSLSLLLNPFTLAVGGQQQETFQALWSNGTWYDYTGLSNWSSNKPTVATVVTGLGHGVSAGGVTFTVSNSTIPVYIPYTCFGYAASCPIAQGAGASAPGTVPPEPTITGLSPSSVITGTSGVWKISGTGFNAFPGAPATVYANTPGITTTGANVVTDSLITVGYRVSPSTAVGGGSLQVSFATTDGGHPSSNFWPYTVSAPTVTVTLSIQSSGTAATDNSARGAYNTEVGRYGLGAFVGTGQFCTIGYQVSGTVSPSTYTGTINLVRTKSGRSWTGSTGQTLDQTFAPGTPDTSSAQFEDTNPQSGGSHGVVYDLDAPGSSPAVSQVGRIRYNFVENAQLPNGTYVANEVAFYVRLSCNWGSAGNSFRTEFTGDNAFGMGTTKTSYNLQ